MFEQSGTFKHVARSLGHKAWDYDICDEFEQTDFVIDLFKEIKKAYYRKASVFDFVREGDYVMAFFPCVRFSTQFGMILRGDQYGMAKKDVKELAMDALQNHASLAEFYRVLTMLVVICVERGIKLVIENPYRNNYLRSYWPFKPSIVYENRRRFGDYYEKPTMFYCFGFEPYDNVIFEALPVVPKKVITEEHGFERSRIAPVFASYFLRAHLIPMEDCKDGE